MCILPTLPLNYYWVRGREIFLRVLWYARYFCSHECLFHNSIKALAWIMRLYHGAPHYHFTDYPVCSLSSLSHIRTYVYRSDFFLRKILRVIGYKQKHTDRLRSAMCDRQGYPFSNYAKLLSAGKLISVGVPTSYFTLQIIIACAIYDQQLKRSHHSARCSDLVEYYSPTRRI